MDVYTYHKSIGSFSESSSIKQLQTITSSITLIFFESFEYFPETITFLPSFQVTNRRTLLTQQARWKQYFSRTIASLLPSEQRLPEHSANIQSGWSNQRGGGLEKERGIPPASVSEAQLSSVAARTAARFVADAVLRPVCVLNVARSVAYFSYPRQPSDRRDIYIQSV